MRSTLNVKSTYTLWRRMNSKSYLLRQPWMNKAFSATTIKEGFDFQSFDVNNSWWFWKNFGDTHCGKCKRPGRSWTFILADLPFQANFCKMALFLTFWANCITMQAGHFERGWLLFPRKKQVEASDSTVASVLGSVWSWSSIWIVVIGTAALTDEGEIWSWA